LVSSKRNFGVLLLKVFRSKFGERSQCQSFIGGDIQQIHGARLVLAILTTSMI